jgi:hypothetical protein
MKKQIILDPAIEEVKSKLPKRCAYSTISGMLGGKYKPETIKAMLAQRRTMSPEVLDAAKKLINFISPETNTDQNESNE